MLIQQLKQQLKDRDKYQLPRIKIHLLLRIQAER